MKAKKSMKSIRRGVLMAAVVKHQRLNIKAASAYQWQNIALKASAWHQRSMAK